MKSESITIALLPLILMGVSQSFQADANSQTHLSNHNVSGESRRGIVEFRAEVPVAPNGMPVLKLVRQPDASELVKKTLSLAELPALNTSALFRTRGIKIPEDFKGIVEGKHIRAWANDVSGDAEIYPTLGGSIEFTPDNLTRARDTATKVFRDITFFQPDDTTMVIAGPFLLKGARMEVKSGLTQYQDAPKTYLAYYVARRFVDEYQVYGPGSRALVGLSGKGVVEGLIRKWRVAGKTGEVLHETHANQDILDAISAQLREIRGSAMATVESIDLAYYDADDPHDNVLRPVYRFVARIHDKNQSSQAEQPDNLIVGYVPYDASAKRHTVPESSPTSTLPCNPAPASGHSRQIATSTSKLKVGRYVIRTRRGSWIEDAKGFWNSLMFSDGSSAFADTQFYCSEPRVFTIDNKTFINAMDVALVEGDGGWWIFSTRRKEALVHSSTQRCCGADGWSTGLIKSDRPNACMSGQRFLDPVNIRSDVPNKGYGRTADGSLGLWILHSCEVVPSPDETSCWANPWWPVFGGIYSVVGYRTSIVVTDDAGPVYASSLRLVAIPLNSSWLQAVTSLSTYSSNPVDTTDCGICRPSGRPSAISPCDDQDDSLLSSPPGGPTDCLAMWWIAD